MTAPSLLGLDEPQRRRDLARMKRTATGFLLVAAALFVVTFALPDAGWVGWVRAAAEAGMVGGLADWFAVTALFRRPLGLPIPHTALIPTRKDALAANLGGFVTEHFLTRDNVRAQLASAELVPRLARQLAAGGAADRLARELSVVAGDLLGSLRADDVARTALELAGRDLHRRPYAGLAGRLLAEVTTGGAHRPLVDLALPYVRTSVVEHRPYLIRQLKAVGSEIGLFGWLLSTDRRIGKLLDEVIALLDAVEADPDHELRALLDDWLHRIADDLQHNPELALRIEAMLAGVLADPQTAGWLTDAVDGALGSVREALADPRSPLAGRLAAALRDLAARVLGDPAFHARLEAWLETAVLYAVEHYASEFSRLVETTVGRWDGPATAERIELVAGKDLQYIRINGTVVGALAGVVLHGVAVLLG